MSILKRIFLLSFLIFEISINVQVGAAAEEKKRTEARVAVSVSGLDAQPEPLEIQTYTVPFNKEKLLVHLPKGKYTVETDPKKDPVIGKGAFAPVLKVKHAGKEYALKRTQVEFSDNLDDRRTLLKELKILNFFRDNPNPFVSSAFDSWLVEDDSKHYLYMVMELLDKDLRRIMIEPRFRNQLGDDHVQCYMRQLFLGLAYIHSAGITHGDIKPANFLLNLNCDGKLTDFGLSFGRSAKEVDGKTVPRKSFECAAGHYLVSRPYRAPELIYETAFGRGIDVYAAGVTMLDLLLVMARKDDIVGYRPYFHADSTRSLHFLLMAPLLGEKAMWKDGVGKADFPERTEAQREADFELRVTNLEKILPGVPTDAIYFLADALTPDPRFRPTSLQMLKHAYLNTSDEQIAVFKGELPDFSKEDDAASTEKLLELILGQTMTRVTKKDPEKSGEQKRPEKKEQKTARRHSLS